MDGARLHTLGASDFSIFQDYVEDKPRLTRKRMVADILERQQQLRETLPATIGPKRVLPTPARRGTGRCSRCGWSSRGPSRAQSVCACEFLNMDPLRSVVAVLDLAHLRDEAPSHTKLASLVTRFKCAVAQENASVELRMCRLSDPRKHEWPHALQVSLDGSDVFSVDAPSDERSRRPDVPLLLAGVDGARESTLELHAQLRLAHKGSDFVACIVQTQPVTLTTLLQDCLRRPEITPAESEGLWMELRDSAVYCSSAWLQPLDCPLTRERIRTPARGVACRHLRCFDFEAYLEVSSRAAFHKRWLCPLCSLPLLPKDARVCTLTRLMLEQAAPGVEAASIETALSSGALGSADASLLQKHAKLRRWKAGVLRESNSKMREPHNVTAWGRRLGRRADPPAVVDL
eukprot:TRINITY_DN6501_c0_g2_i1.p1 TRINITY_DN6501_c0_g2~~TRINITY_DN6501_c0_g2_i1.p1  ORF type:complete len:403 (+),score=47.89 TRINITY_DN6501_c0_g2_i1:53-1261(+)